MCIRDSLQHDDPRSGDVYVLCSDGLSGMVEDEEILSLVKERSDIGEVCAALIAKANEHGGEDNVTAVVIKIEAPEETTVQDALDGPDEPTSPGLIPRAPSATEEFATRETALPDLGAVEKTPRAPESK